MILVIDLEATCSNDGAIPAHAMEVIEIGACWAEADGRVIDQFRSFVRPIERPVLTEFCAQLTGIRQQDVDSAPNFAEVCLAWRAFAAQHAQAESVWLSWGAYDRKQIDLEIARHGIAHPLPLPHINAKKQFAKLQRVGKEVGMSRALSLCGLELEGAHHRALDDALNIARMLPWITGARLLRDEKGGVSRPC
ncbi:3'-5' exonuclease [Chitinilyticum litopenaei]|uniref:3'-5' exonuclease n=1 Tax=Chitinilyticum litopenaei TaxID=1121276 RepID=UPI000428DACA|nr:3'-5' exonuclease [Chitinilyticum litopenaei]